MDVISQVSILETHAMNEKEATELSCAYLGAEEDQILVTLREKGSSGFLGLGQKKPSLFHVLARPGKTPEEVIIKGVVTNIVNKMGYKVKFKKIETTEDNKTYVEMVSPSAGFLIGKYGKTLEALQFISNLLVERVMGKPPRLLLDIENYRERRKKHLEDMANRAAEYVVRTKKYRLLEPLNPYERRIVHMALQENELVETESEGNTAYKKVKIFLKSGANINQPSPTQETDEFPTEEDPHNVLVDPEEPLQKDEFPDDDIGNRISEDEQEAHK